MSIYKYTEYAVQCDVLDCHADSFSEPYKNLREAERILRNQGWSKTSYGKWVCPEHDKKEQLKFKE